MTDRETYESLCYLAERLRFVAGLVRTESVGPGELAQMLEALAHKAETTIGRIEDELRKERG